MTGLFLIIFAVLTLIFFILFLIDFKRNGYNTEGLGITTVILFLITVGYLSAIPISRIDSKANIEYAKIFQETLDHNREIDGEFNVLERTNAFEEINVCNSVIKNWKVKGQKWYNNKWYYHPDTQKAEYIK